jgi:arginine repressor
LTEVAGTVAGDDTVLLVCRIADPVTDPTGAVAASRLAERLLRLADGHPAEPTS